MKTLLFLLLSLILVHTQIKISTGVSILNPSSLNKDDLDSMVKRDCGGKIGDHEISTGVSNLKSLPLKKDDLDSMVKRVSGGKIGDWEIPAGVSVLNPNSLKKDDPGSMVKRAGGGKVGECADDNEMMESESSRRVLLMGKRYISYETLKRDVVPCGTPGASYYNCGKGVASPYNRGCEIITRCSRDAINT